MKLIKQGASIVVHVGLLAVGKIIRRVEAVANTGAVNVFKHGEDGAAGVIIHHQFVLKTDDLQHKWAVNRAREYCDLLCSQAWSGMRETL